MVLNQHQLENFLGHLEMNLLLEVICKDLLYSLFFYFLLFFKINNKIYLSIIYIILFLIYLTALVLSGNRMPLILFVFMTILIFMFEKSIRKYLIFKIATIIIICTALVNSNDLIKSNFSNFFTQVQSISKILTTSEINKSE